MILNYMIIIIIIILNNKFVKTIKKLVVSDLF